MRKVLNWSLALFLCFALIGCKTKDEDKTKNNDTSKNEEKEVTDPLNDNDNYLIDGKKFKAGDKLSDLEEAGYSLKESSKSEEVPANKYMIGAGYMYNSEEKSVFDVTPFNPSDSAVNIQDSFIGGFSLDDYSAKNDARLLTFEVYGGIKLGSTDEEVKKAFGEPSSVTDLEEYARTVYHYNSDEVYRSYKITFGEEGKVISIEWKNLEF